MLQVPLEGDPNTKYVLIFKQQLWWMECGVMSPPPQPPNQKTISYLLSNGYLKSFTIKPVKLEKLINSNEFKYCHGEELNQSLFVPLSIDLMAD